VLAWLAGRLAHLTPPRPPGQGGTPRRQPGPAVAQAGRAGVLPDGSFVTTQGDVRERLAERVASTGMRRSGTGGPRIGSLISSGRSTGCRRGCALVEQAIGHLANAWALRRWRGLLYRVRDVFRAAGALVCLGRWLHRVPH